MLIENYQKLPTRTMKTRFTKLRKRLENANTTSDQSDISIHEHDSDGDVKEEKKNQFTPATHPPVES
jgi:hypothetical protein